MKKVISMLLSLVMIISVFSLTQLNAFASKSTTVKFEQSEARTVLNMINSFRASSDAWYCLYSAFCYFLGIFFFMMGLDELIFDFTKVSILHLWDVYI